MKNNAAFFFLIASVSLAATPLGAGDGFKFPWKLRKSTETESSSTKNIEQKSSEQSNTNVKNHVDGNKVTTDTIERAKEKTPEKAQEKKSEEPKVTEKSKGRSWFKTIAYVSIPTLIIGGVLWYLNSQAGSTQN